MPRDENFIKTSGMVILGLLSVVIGLLIVIILIPQLQIAGGGALISAFLFLVVWLVIYIGLVISAMIVHFFGPIGMLSSSPRSSPSKKFKPVKAKKKKRR